MNLEKRWLPVIREDEDVTAYGPAVRDLQDAKDWCQLEQDGYLEDRGDESEPLPWAEDNGTHGAFGVDEVDFEITPVDVEV